MCVCVYAHACRVYTHVCRVSCVPTVLPLERVVGWVRWAWRMGAWSRAGAASKAACPDFPNDTKSDGKAYQR